LKDFEGKYIINHKSQNSKMGKGLRLEDLEVYKVSMEIGEIVWGL
jgi:hypothetical protein